MTAALFPAVACDYDGTPAVHDRIPRDSLEALAEAKSAGIRLVLVTGRVLLRRLAKR